MALYDFRSLCAAFHNIGINRALREEFDAVQLARFFFKHADKFLADDLTFLFGIGNIGKFR